MLLTLRAGHWRVVLDWPTPRRPRNRNSPGFFVQCPLSSAPGIPFTPGPLAYLLRNRLDDLGEVRIKEMDEAGIDMQVLSHGAPSAQKLSGSDAVDLTRRVNDRLHAVVTANSRWTLPLRILALSPSHNRTVSIH